MTQAIHAFHVPLAVDQGLGRFREEPDYDRYVKSLIRQVLLTSPGERVHRPEFGAGLRRLIFAPLDETSASLVETTVFEALDRSLGSLLTMQQIEVAFSDTTVTVTVAYQLKALSGARSLRLEVARP